MKPLLLTPLVIFLLIFMVMAAKLLDGEKQNSALIGKPLPEISLPAIGEVGQGLVPEDFKGKYSLVNIFASWCVSCRVEHPFLMQLKEKNILPIYGINWKDKPEDASAWLEKLGNPYTKTGADMEGRAIIALGVTGAPETLLVSPEGIIIYRFPGPLTKDIFDKEIMGRVR